MLHLARPERAMTHAVRVLKPGGCFAFTVWAEPEEAVGFGIILKAVQFQATSGCNCLRDRHSSDSVIRPNATGPWAKPAS